MLLGNKMTQHNVLQMGNKKNAGIQLFGNKINGEARRVVLSLPPHNVAHRTSPIEKYHTNNH